MPKSKPDDLNARLATLAEERSLSDIARRTGTSVANVSRYLSGTRIPGEFCSNLVRGLGVNPSWLLTGEGSPYLSDVTEGTARMAGDVLELVEAMSAVTHMRLGALTGKHHLRVLRELNDALLRYEELRAKLNGHSAPIFRRLVEDLGKALDGFDMDRAHELRRAAQQVERLCDEPELSRRFTGLQAHCEVLDLNNTAAMEYQRKLVRDAVCEGRMADKWMVETFVRMALITSDGGRHREALRICDAAVALLDEESETWQPAYALKFMRGSILAKQGRLFEGLREMQVHAPLVKGRRGKAGRLMLMRALLMAGLMELDEAYAFGVDAEPKGLHLLEFAAWTEDATPIRKALKFFREEVSVLPGFLEGPVYAEFALKALSGDRKAAASYLQRLRAEAKVKAPGMHMLTSQATLSRMAGAKAVACKFTLQADALLPGLQPEVLQLGRHYRNVLRLGITGEPKQRAEAFFRDMQQAGYRVFDGELA
ncbi:MAG: helix-turn-helix transcriptional regulator [Planctomycetes bacterium]|nr:helix-turn-helix transcriptional regulator [Planctomycetota bacterium]